VKSLGCVPNVIICSWHRKSSPYCNANARKQATVIALDDATPHKLGTSL